MTFSDLDHEFMDEKGGLVDLAGNAEVWVHGSLIHFLLDLRRLV